MGLVWWEEVGLRREGESSPREGLKVKAGLQQKIPDNQGRPNPETGPRSVSCTGSSREGGAAPTPTPGTGKEPRRCGWGKWEGDMC